MIPARSAVPPLGLLGLLALAGCGPAPEPPVPAGGASAVTVIPLPRVMEAGQGVLRLGPDATVRVEPDSPELREAVEVVLDPMRRRTGIPLRFAAGSDTESPGIVVQLGGGPPEVTGLGLAPTRPGALDEGYRLRVDPAGAVLEAGTAPGLLHGLRTLDQLVDGSGVAPAVTIDDRPRFPYRGLHLDVGRHLFPVDFVLRYVDLLSRYKLNAFHWHLTEDQGWRIQIDRYPRLTRVAAFRPETRVGHASEEYVGDGRPYGGYYTKDEIRRVVAYAAERGVTVIPEIELPGHARAAIAAYPELGCTGEPVEVATTWGVFEEIFCPSETTFRFLEGVLDEVLELFPSELIHIGGDEAPKTAWEESALAQEVIRREGLADEHELQSWFIRRIESFLRSRGRRLVGWDEILEGGLAPDATVMSWRGEAGGIAAAEMGHDVIMTPNPVAYLDHYQGDPEGEPLTIGGYTPIEEVYGWEPVPEALSGERRVHVLGGQGNVWTEYMPSSDHVEYMVWPRALALAEVLWSPADRRDLDDFRSRLPGALTRLDELGVGYRIPEIAGVAGERLVLDDRITLRLAPPVAGGRVLLTTDGSDPDTTTPPARGPVTLRVPTDGLRLAARVAHPDGRLGPVARGTVRSARPRPALPLPAGTVPGLAWSLVTGSVTTVDALPGRPVVDRGVMAEPAIPPAAPAEGFGLIVEGWLDVPETGIYTLHLLSDDGSRLEIGGEVVVDHDGLHGPEERSHPVALEAGAHPLRLLYFQAGGGRSFALEVTPATGGRRGLDGWTRATPPPGG